VHNSFETNPLSRPHLILYKAVMSICVYIKNFYVRYCNRYESKTPWVLKKVWGQSEAAV